MITVFCVILIVILLWMLFVATFHSHYPCGHEKERAGYYGDKKEIAYCPQCEPNSSRYEVKDQSEDVKPKRKVGRPRKNKTN